MLKTERGVSNHGRCFAEEGIKDSRRSRERSGPCLEGSALGGEELGGPGRGIGTGGWLSKAGGAELLGAEPLQSRRTA